MHVGLFCCAATNRRDVAWRAGRIRTGLLMSTRSVPTDESAKRPSGAFWLHEINTRFRVIPRNDVRHRVCFGALGEKAPPKRG